MGGGLIRLMGKVLRLLFDALTGQMAVQVLSVFAAVDHSILA